jgi:excisionase family DNA binding protein
MSSVDTVRTGLPGPDDAHPVWLSTAEAANRLGITPRTLYRFIDEGQLPAYRFGRVIRLQQREVDAFIERSRIQPGTLDHLYPEPSGALHDADGDTAGIVDLEDMVAQPASRTSDTA